MPVPSKVVVQVKDLHKRYGDVHALRGLSLDVYAGQILGFLGPNGAGKTTAIKILSGYLAADSGSASICGFDSETQGLEVKQVLGYLPENNPLYLDMYVKEYLTFVGNIYKVPNLKERVDEMIEKVGLEVEQNKKIGQLSKGYRQRVGLAQAIIHDPEVLILDEPTSGLDPNQLLEIRSLIKSIGKEKTVMLSTHIMQEVEAICDRIVIINKGEIVADNTAKDLQSEGGNLTVYAEFEGEVTKSMLKKIEGVGKIERVTNGWLLESKDNVDLRKRVAKFAQENDFLAITLRVEEKSLEEVFKNLTNR